MARRVYDFVVKLEIHMLWFALHRRNEPLLLKCWMIFKMIKMMNDKNKNKLEMFFSLLSS